eukprot:scaffold12882_cov73-Skeletonema_marinoi.AAC.2
MIAEDGEVGGWDSCIQNWTRVVAASRVFLATCIQNRTRVVRKKPHRNRDQRPPTSAADPPLSMPCML